jgi:hypothetical protein
MKEMIHRTTFALDQETAMRLRRLAAAWQVSQAEVVRRSVAMAETAGPLSEDAASLLTRLHNSGDGLIREAAEKHLSVARKDRQAWRGDP